MDQEQGDKTVTKQPKGSNSHGLKQETASFDSDAYVQRQMGVCCLPTWCDNGEDERWYYPWDKGLARMCGLCCMWYCVCLFFPCCICVDWCRGVICMVDQGAWNGTLCESFCKKGVYPDKGTTKENGSDS